MLRTGIGARLSAEGNQARPWRQVIADAGGEGEGEGEGHRHQQDPADRKVVKELEEKVEVAGVIVVEAIAAAVTEPRKRWLSHDVGKNATDLRPGPQGKRQGTATPAKPLHRSWPATESEAGYRPPCAPTAASHPFKPHCGKVIRPEEEFTARPGSGTQFPTERSHVCAAAITLKVWRKFYESKRRFLGVPKYPRDVMSCCVATLQVSPCNRVGLPLNFRGSTGRPDLTVCDPRLTRALSMTQLFYR